MLFNSFEFLVFFPIVVALYFVVSHRLRWLVLLIASCIFYMAFVPAYILILGATILIDYLAGMLIEDATTKESKKMFLILSILSNISILFTFKYLNFFIDATHELARLIHWNYSIETLAIVLPLGLSFHLFQSLAYIIEVYKGKQVAERDFGHYALYVMFFPQLVAGPIERPQHLLHQFHERHVFSRADIVEGLQLMLWGFFKKIVIADNLALVVDHVYQSLHAHDGPALLITTLLFTVQIYADFSGYSDIARGSALIFGIRLMKNFDRPFVAISIADFWRRWHISLSSWLRDYVYYPLIWSRKKMTPTWIAVSVVVTFFLSGVWHGAGYTYAVMGLIFGFYIVSSMLTKNIRQRLVSLLFLERMPELLLLLRIVCTFGLVSVAWIFFRAANLSDAFFVLTNLGTHSTSLGNISYIRTVLFDGSGLGISGTQFFTELVFIAFLFYVELVRGAESVFRLVRQKVPRMISYYAIIGIILIFGAFGSAPFIYFQF